MAIAHQSLTRCSKAHNHTLILGGDIQQHNSVDRTLIRFSILHAPALSVRTTRARAGKLLPHGSR